MCDRLKGNGKDWYKCALTGKRCPYQRYCTEKHKFLIEKSESCPAFKEKTK